MANSAVSSTPRNGVSLRKTNKPLMEKRRRARINDSLSQLKSLVIHSSKKDSSQFSKLEKADILELTVKHLRGLQNHHHHQQQQQQQQQINSADSSAVSNKYRTGFVECANEVMRYLDQSQGFNNDTKSKVVSHLAQCLQLVSHVQPKQVTTATAPVITAPPPAPTATILNAPTATTQLPNGQIIQIVSNPIQQNIQPGRAVATSAATGILGFKQPVVSSLQLQGFAMNPSTSSSSVTVSTGACAIQSNSQSHPATTAAQQTAYVRYTQPLHIQIPPLVSPLLIQQHTQQQQQQPTKMTAAATTAVTRETINNKNNIASYCLSSASAEHSQDVVSSSTTTMAVSPLPVSSSSFSSLSSSSSSSSPPPSHSSLPKVRAQKQLNFYSSEEVNVELLARSRTYSMTSSSSSSSSSETEMTSPLNLSQSPPYLSQKFDSRVPSYHQHSTLSSIPHSALPEHYHMSQPIPLKVHDNKSSSINSIPLHHHSNSRSSSANSFQEKMNFGLNTTSVIVNSRKYAEFPESKYFSMMDDDRHCINHHGTPSPASSMGEERLWRPW